MTRLTAASERREREYEKRYKQPTAPLFVTCLEHMDEPTSENNTRADAFPEDYPERGNGASRPMNRQEGDCGTKGRGRQNGKNAADVKGQGEVSRLLVRARVRGIGG